MYARNGTEFGRIGRVIRWGLLGLFMLIGVAIVATIVGRLFVSTSGGLPWQGFYAPLFFPFGFLLFFFLLFGFGWLFRPWRWGWGWWGYPRLYWDQRIDATEILRQRYARGEIGKEPFDQMMRDLEHR